jgi:hypothetical protein
MSVIFINPYQFAPAGPTDPFFSNVSLLLHGYGANNSTTITDSSPSPKTATAVHGAKIVTGVADPFGNTARGVMAFTDNSSIRLPPSSVWDLPGDFTIEMWSNQGAAAGDFATMFEYGSTSNNVDQGVLMRTGDSRIFLPNTSTVLASSVQYTQGSWIHWALVRNGSTVNAYRHGTSIASSTVTVTLTASGLGSLGTGGIWLGDSVHSPNRGWNGYLADLRVTKGIARYTANFTPPTAPFPDT